LSPLAIILNNLHIFSHTTMNYKTACAIASIVVVVSFATSAGSILQTASAEKPNQCGISGLVHDEQQFVGGVQGGNFGRAVGGYNGNPAVGGNTGPGFQGSTDAAHEAQTEAATGCAHNP
jgi:hypothetical protein